MNHPKYNSKVADNTRSDLSETRKRTHTHTKAGLAIIMLSSVQFRGCLDAPTCNEDAL